MPSTLARLTVNELVVTPEWRAEQDLRQNISDVDARVWDARAVAYTSDEHGALANPAARPEVRGDLALLALLMLRRDGHWPSWWRSPGQLPDWRS